MPKSSKAKAKTKAKSEKGFRKDERLNPREVAAKDAVKSASSKRKKKPTLEEALLAAEIAEIVKRSGFVHVGRKSVVH